MLPLRQLIIIYAWLVLISILSTVNLALPALKSLGWPAKQNNFKTNYQLLNPQMYKQNAYTHTVVLKSKSCGSWTPLGFTMLFSNRFYSGSILHYYSYLVLGLLRCTCCLPILGLDCTLFLLTSNPSWSLKYSFPLVFIGTACVWSGIILKIVNTLEIHYRNLLLNQHHWP